MAWFYEIRSSNNAVLKRDGGFASQDAAKMATRLPDGQGRDDAMKMKNSRQVSGQALQPDRPATAGKPEVGRILVGQNAEKPTRQ